MAVRRRGRRWVADYRDGLGRRRWVSCRTKAQAEEIEARERLAARAGRNLRPHIDPELALAAYARRWLSQITATVKPSTAAGYEQRLRVHVLPAFGTLPLRKLTRGGIKALLIEKLRSGLARDSVRLIHATLRALLNAAVDDEIIAANPSVRLGKALRLATPASRRQEEIKALDRDQLATLLAAARETGGTIQLLLLVMARTGVRVGEARALRWEDLDFNHSEARIERAVSSIGVISTPKSGHGRTVDLSRGVVRVLRDEWVASGQPANGWVFPSAADTPLDYANTRKLFERVKRTAKLPKHF